MLIAAASIALLFSACSTAPKQKSPEILSTTTSTTPSGRVITDEMIGRSKGTMKLSRPATDSDYGYSEKSPVKVGGGFGSGSERTYQFLNALRGPAGESIKYDRIGTCCPFKSPNSPFDGEALLEVYEVSIGGGTPKRLYFNWYDGGDLFVPFGFSAAP